MTDTAVDVVDAGLYLYEEVSNYSVTDRWERSTGEVETYHQAERQAVAGPVPPDTSTRSDANEPSALAKLWQGIKVCAGQVLTGTVEVVGGVLTCSGVISCAGRAVLATDGISRVWSGVKDGVRAYNGEKTGYGSDDFVGNAFKGLCGEEWGNTCRDATVGLASLGTAALEQQLARRAAIAATTTAADATATVSAEPQASTGAPTMQDPVPAGVTGEDALASDWANISGTLREATRGKGMFGVGSASVEQTSALGEAWAGPGARWSSDGTASVSADGLRQYRPPTWKPNQGIVQANLEWRNVPSGKWQNNAHIDVLYGPAVPE